MLCSSRGSVGSSSRFSAFSCCGKQGVEALDFLGAHFAHVRVGVVGHLAGGHALRGQVYIIAVGGRHGLQPRVLHGQLTELLRAPGNLRVREQAADFLEAFRGLFQFLANRGFHGRTSYSGAMMPDPSRSMSVLRSILLLALAASAAGCASSSPEKAPAEDPRKAAVEHCRQG